MSKLRPTPSGVLLRVAVGLLSCVAVACFGFACRPSDESATDGDPPNESAHLRGNLLVFPDDLRAEDESVNEFLERAMRTCAAGNYDDFRLIWSVRKEPLSRDEYEQGWQAVQEIRIRALEKVMLAPDSGAPAGDEGLVYAVLANVTLDPTHPAAQSEPQREVTLMLVREYEQWRLAHAPKRLRAWIQGKLEAAQAPGG